eukprot:gene11539-4792_t
MKVFWRSLNKSHSRNFVVDAFEKYRNPTIFEQETKKIFKNNHWLFLDFEKNLKREKGSYLSIDYATLPIFVVRNEQLQLRAFLNVCSHRALNLVDFNNLEGCSGNNLFCRHHGWSFSFDGEFLLPDSVQNEKIRKSTKRNLIQIPMKLHNGMIFVNLTNKFDNEFKIGSEFEKISHQVSSFIQEKDVELFSHQQEDIKCNWKVIIENYQKGVYFNPEVDYKNMKVQSIKDENLMIHLHNEKNDSNINIFKYPNLIINSNETDLYLMLIIPMSITETKVISFHYGKLTKPKEKVEQFFNPKSISQKELEIFQDFLELGVLVESEVNKEYNDNPEFFQQLISKDLEEKQEKI